jgi:hypothetical protein
LWFPYLNQLIGIVLQKTWSILKFRCFFMNNDKINYILVLFSSVLYPFILTRRVEYGKYILILGFN